LILSERRRRKWLVGTLLAAFGVRALIPPGFMPASDRPFSLEVCWEGLPAGMLARGEPSHVHSMSMDAMDMDSTDTDSGSTPAHQHSGKSSHSEHCVFGTACSAGPIPHPLLPSSIPNLQQLLAVDFVSAAGDIRVVHLPQPRAPPGRLS
jgi:hypothetical protein